MWMNQYLIFFLIANLFAHALSAKEAPVTEPISPFPGYNKRVVVELRQLRRLHRKEQSELLRSHGDLNAPLPTNSTELVAKEEDNIFTAVRPTIQWMERESKITCDAVQYANKSAQYLFRRFKELRGQAIQYLDEMDTASGKKLSDITKKYDAITLEINELLNLVEAAFPPSFTAYDRVAAYTFDESNYFKSQKRFPNRVPWGDPKITKVKFGHDDWVLVNAGIKGMGNFLHEPKISRSDSKITVERQLNAMEACLGDLSVSFVGSVEFRIVVSPIITCPSYTPASAPR